MIVFIIGLGIVGIIVYYYFKLTNEQEDDKL